MLSTVRVINPDRVAVYIRWSTEEQGQGTTLEVQREACEYYCKSQGWHYQEDLLFVDEGYSGATLDRPSLGRMRAAVGAGLVECVVVYKLDRLSRNLLDCVTLVRKEWGDRCGLYSTRENLDTQSSVGQMVFNILVSFAEFERNVIRDRTQSGKRKRAEQGRNAGQIYPYGYTKGPDGGWALDGWDEERQCFTGRAAVMRRIFENYISGISARAIADELRKEGVPASRGGDWRYNTVSALLANSAYAGTYTYGKNRGGKRSQDPLITVENAVPPIVSQQEWETVKRMRTERAAQSPRSVGSDYLLSGIARCGKCGGTLAGAGKRGGYRYYICTRRVFLKDCDCAYIDGNKLEEQVMNEVMSTISLDNIQHHVEIIEKQLWQRGEQCTLAADEAQEVLEETERKRKRLDQEFFAGNLDGKMLSRLSEALDKEAEMAGQRLERARADLQEALATSVDIDQMVQLSHLVDAWAELTTEEIKQVLREIVGSLAVYQQKVAVHSKKANPNPLDIVWQPRLNLLCTVARPNAQASGQ